MECHDQLCYLVLFFKQNLVLGPLCDATLRGVGGLVSIPRPMFLSFFILYAIWEKRIQKRIERVPSPPTKIKCTYTY